jgi:alkanesulfonate monooxygenase SsuD/methylene tetrahydromethanopterin reductase-like flavin-dependent oxidoreductase (luciferase family)
MVGGGGERRTLRTLARYGDVMNVSGTPDEVKVKISVLERHCRDAGRNPGEIRKTVFTPVIVSENEKLIDRVATMIAAGGAMTVEEAKRRAPIGPPQHVRGVIEHYADIGVSEVIMMAQAPWKREIYARLDKEIVGPFA